MKDKRIQGTFFHGLALNAFMILFLSFLVTAKSIPAIAITNCGVLLGDETWSGTLFLTCNVIIPPGVTLTIAPGTIVRFNAGEGLKIVVNGRLIAEGSETSQIAFTSSADEPSKGDWTWIRFNPIGDGSIKYCRIEYANTGIMCDSSSPAITYNTFSNNNYGINLNGASSTIENNFENDCGLSSNNGAAHIRFNEFCSNVHDGMVSSGSLSSMLVIKNNAFSNNGYYGLEMEYASSPDVQNNTFYNNTKSGIYVKNRSMPLIENNIITNGSNYGILIWDSSPIIRYNNLWANTVANYYHHAIGPAVNPTPGTGEISSNPFFVDPQVNNFHLRAGSPAIDKGNPDSDYSKEPEPNGNRINLGKYGNTSEAMTSAIEIVVELNLKAGWNLISLPVTPVDSSLATLFPDATIAYEFDNVYKKVNRLKPGIGYWITVPSNKAYIISGQDYKYCSVTLSKGWHLLGAVNDATLPATDPPGAIAVIYSFSDTYSVATEFIAGRGYWVKIEEEECEFTLTR